MFSLVWPRLAQARRTDSHWAIFVFGLAAGLLLPLLLVMAGWLVDLLLLGGSGTMPDRVSVGSKLVIETRWLNAGSSVLRAVLGLIVLMVIVAFLETIALLANYRVASNNSIEFAVDIQRRLFQKSGTLAVEQGLSGQQAALREHLQTHVPQMREALLHWYRAFPRHLIQCIALLAIASSVQPWFTLLAAICLLILWMVYGALNNARRRRMPVLVERVRSANEQLAYFCETAPLLASVHAHEETESGFEGQLHSYRQTQQQIADVGVWKSPTMLLAAVFVAVLLAIVLSVRLLDEPNALKLGESLTMCAAVFLSVVSLLRLLRAHRHFKAAEPAVQKVADYLDQATPKKTDGVLVTPKQIETQLILEHVSFRDSTGQKLLEDISIHLQPNQLTAIVASEPMQARALAELILGFGRPASGRILVDGRDSTDLDPDAFRQLSLWIAPNGPLISGSIETNLWTNGVRDATIDVMGIAKQAHVSEAILNLVDGMSTMVTPSEDRLQPDHLFRIGVARGLIKRPSLAVAEEPRTSVRQKTESDTLDALLQLRNTGAMVVVLPNRLGTLRTADQIIVLHDHRIENIGTHADLLERSEIYRHLNYIKFSSPEIAKE